MMYTDSMSIGSGGLRVSGVAPPTPFKFQKIKKKLRNKAKIEETERKKRETVL